MCSPEKYREAAATSFLRDFKESLFFDDGGGPEFLIPFNSSLIRGESKETPLLVLWQ
jgi:hypothetical protein